jgi:hypothetical protein
MHVCNLMYVLYVYDAPGQWRTEGGSGGSNPPPEIPKF